ILLLPGPPAELKAMFIAECLPRLKTALPPRHIARRVLKMAMLPESEVDARLAPIYTRFNDVETTILAHVGEVQLHLQCAKTILEVAQARVQELASRVEEEMEDDIFSSNGESLE